MTERELQAAVVEMARMFGWRVAHFRPARTERGWRTPVAADGAGIIPSKGVCSVRRDRPERLRALVKEWLESGKEIFPQELQELTKAANNVFPSEPWRFVQRYDQGRLEVHIHVLIRPERSREEIHGCCVVLRSKTAGNAELRFLEPCDPVGYGDQVPVLVDVREGTDERQGMGRRIGSLVRLQALNECRSCVGDSASYSDATYPTLPILRAIKDREGSALSGHSVVGENELPCEVVKAGPQVVSDVADHDGLVLWWRFRHSETPGSFPIVRVVLADTRVGATLDVPPDFKVERAYVLLRPTELESYAV